MGKTFLRHNSRSRAHVTARVGHQAVFRYDRSEPRAHRLACRIWEGTRVRTCSTYAVVHASPLELETLRGAVQLARQLDGALSPSHTFMDQRSVGAAFELRVEQWLKSRGVQVHPPNPGPQRRFDILGVEDGRLVVVECKVSSRGVTVAMLRRWIEHLIAQSSAIDNPRRILVLRAPAISQAARRYAHTMPVEVFIEQRPGEFVTADDLIK